MYTLTCTNGTQSDAKNTSIAISAYPGIASYRNFKVNPPLAATPNKYSLEVDLAAFDSLAYQPATLTALRTTSRNLAVPGTNGSQTFGAQQFTLQGITCSQGTTANPYDALMLFDRSGSMSSNDPQDETLTAAKEFVNRLESSGRALIAAFPGGTASRPQNPVTFYAPAFTSDKTQLLAGIAAVGPPEGNTPLWQSMDISLNQFPTTAAGTTNRVLLTFSDGENNGATPPTVSDIRTKALARQTKVFAINLRNSNSQELDSIANATGGSIYSTDDAKKMLAFYGTLGQLLAGKAVNCKATVALEFVPAAGFTDVAYGPASGTKTTLEFAATSGTRNVVVETELLLPLYPGRKVGQTNAAKSVYETDIRDLVTTTCGTKVGATIRNDCTEPVWMFVCNAANVALCNRGLVQPGAALQAYAATTTPLNCVWREPIDKYEVVRVSGTAPNQVFTLPDGTAPNGSLKCVNTVRGPY